MSQKRANPSNMVLLAMLLNNIAYAVEMLFEATVPRPVPGKSCASSQTPIYRCSLAANQTFKKGIAPEQSAGWALRFMRG